MNRNLTENLTVFEGETFQCRGWVTFLCDVLNRRLNVQPLIDNVFGMAKQIQNPLLSAKKDSASVHSKIDANLQINHLSNHDYWLAQAFTNYHEIKQVLESLRIVLNFLHSESRVPPIREFVDKKLNYLKISCLNGRIQNTGYKTSVQYIAQ